MYSFSAQILRISIYFQWFILKAAIKKAKEGLKGMIEERRSLRRLRQDLERVRLLCELMRKREQRKRELILAHKDIVELKCYPFKYFLKALLTSLKEIGTYVWKDNNLYSIQFTCILTKNLIHGLINFSIDQQEIFAELVSIEDVPDYLDHIKKPMAFSTMQVKLEAMEYKGIDEFEADFNIMVENCLSYNERETIFFRAGVKMRDQGGTIIRQAKREIENIGFDPETGLHTSERLTPKEEFSGKKWTK